MECCHPQCEVSLVDHVQRFVQASGCIQLMVRQLGPDDPIPIVEKSYSVESVNEDAKRDALITWVSCLTCRSRSPFTLVSREMWHLSFFKYLDTLLNTPASWTCRNTVPPLCKHSANKGLHHCFALNKRIVIFTTGIC
ncbi:unnamed protein product [Protopolystoma xenopodis]|uniref:Uncharacterized protein n=1 Tax=Protopolystoma xenopodis TaxID=117903 RepID=A0A3S5A8V3_9PLAT|nr:unnamed protein product [Protopolystoma xenopodis]